MSLARTKPRRGHPPLSCAGWLLTVVLAALTLPARGQGPDGAEPAVGRTPDGGEQALTWIQRLRAAQSEADDQDPLAPDEQDRLLGRIVGLPRPVWMAWIDQLAESPRGHPDRRVAVRLLGAGGSGSDIARMTELAELEEEDGLLSRTFAPVFEVALADLLAREPAARSRLRSVALNAPLAVRRSMACALGLLEPHVALEELTALLGFDADLDPTLLAQIARAAGRSPKPLEERLVWPVRAGLSADSPRCVAAAATALGALEDLDALDDLLSLLRHPDGAVRQSSHRALQAIAGVRLPAQPARWELWVSEERAWYEERSPDLGTELASSNRLTLAQALGEIVVHPLYRRELCFDVAALLQRREPGVRSLACQILAQLGVVETVPDLIPALEDESESVAREAWKALRAITGKGLSPEPDVWWAWHAGEGTDPHLEEPVGGWIKAPQGSRR